MITVTIQIGNSDDKLPQREWAEYIQRVQTRIEGTALQVHFSGGSLATSAWQNYCWVVEVRDQEELRTLRRQMAWSAEVFRQESVAFTVGKTELVEASK